MTQSILRQWIKHTPDAADAYVPDFHVCEEAPFIVIADRDRPVAVFHRTRLTLDMREFYPDGRSGATFDIRRPYHKPSVQGAFLPCNWRIRSQGVDSDPHPVQVVATGTRLVLTVDETFGEGESGHTEISIGYDADLRCYAVEKKAELALHEPLQVEAANLWARGCGEAWEQDATLRYTLWTNAAGGLTWFPHNPLTPNLPGNLDVAGSHRRLPAGGFIAMGRRDTSNPAIELVGCHTSAVGCATCSAWYDEHVFLGCPMPPDETGTYRWRFHCRLISIPPDTMDAMRSAAVLLDFEDDPAAYDRWSFLSSIRAAGRQVQPFDRSLPFTPGRPAGFDAPIDPEEELVGLYWGFGSQPHGRITWDREAQALLMEGRDEAADLVCVPHGPSIRGYEHLAHRLKGRIRTEGNVSAWLELTPFLFIPRELTERNGSHRVTGTSEWTAVEVNVPAISGKDYLDVRLRQQGKGRAWFDDVLLEQAP